VVSRRARIALAVALLASSGCYTSANVSYVAYPDLTNVRFSGGAARARIDHLGVVQTSLTADGSCEEVAVTALRNLVAEANAIGGTRVEEVQFRGRWSWLGQPVCRGLGEKTVHVRGFAVK
jgi:hypothetical protein